MLTIRNETPADFQAVEDLTRRAFYNLYLLLYTHSNS